MRACLCVCIVYFESSERLLFLLQVVSICRYPPIRCRRFEPLNRTDVKHANRGGEKYLPQTVVLKLNGGLGTSMGLDKAKSLLPVKGDDSFLDLTAKQVDALRSVTATAVESIETSKAGKRCW